MMAAADIYRPAAINQLQTLGKQLGLPVFSMGDKVSPAEIAQKQSNKQRRNTMIMS